MNLSIFVVIIGAMLLFVPQGTWIGIGLMGIGLVLSQMERKEPMAFAQAPPKFMQVMQQQESKQSAGVGWSTTNPFNKKKQTPGIENGMFNLPLPVGGELAQFMDLNYKTPTGAKGMVQQRDKKNPFLPDL
jgi:hypothetical protein